MSHKLHKNPSTTDFSQHAARKKEKKKSKTFKNKHHFSRFLYTTPQIHLAGFYVAPDPQIRPHPDLLSEVNSQTFTVNKEAGVISHATDSCGLIIDEDSL